MKTIGIFFSIIIGISALPLNNVPATDRNLVILGALALLTFGALLAGCACCRRKQTGFELNKFSRLQNNPNNNNMEGNNIDEKSPCGSQEKGNPTEVSTYVLQTDAENSTEKDPPKIVLPQNICSKKAMFSAHKPVFTKNTKVPVTIIDDGLSFSELSKMTLKVTIVDANAPELRITLKQFSDIEYAIQDAMWERIDADNNKSYFVGASMDERFRGYRIISCGSEETLKFLKDTVSGLGELWPGANIQVRHLLELPKAPLIKLNLPVRDMSNAKKVLGILMANNSDLPIKNWKLTQIGKPFDGRIPVLFRVDENTIRLLEEKGFKIIYGIRSVMVNVQQSDLQAEIVERAVSIDEINEKGLDIDDLFNSELELNSDLAAEIVEKAVTIDAIHEKELDIDDFFDSELEIDSYSDRIRSEELSFFEEA